MGWDSNTEHNVLNSQSAMSSILVLETPGSFLSPFLYALRIMVLKGLKILIMNHWAKFHWVILLLSYTVKLQYPPLADSLSPLHRHECSHMEPVRIPFRKTETMLSSQTEAV